MPDPENKKLLLSFEELRRREDHENDREKTANSKLTTSLVALPIIISLSTTAFFVLLTNAVRFGIVGFFATTLFILALAAFMAAATMSIVGLWPMRSKYHFIGLRTIVRFPQDKSHEEFLEKLILERADVVKGNGRVNADKLGWYANSSALMVIGLGLLAVVVIIFAIGAFVAPDRLLGSTVVQPPVAITSAQPTTVPYAAPARALPTPTRK
jgi:membrane protein implicated in regulation of membrane protease activity